MPNFETLFPNKTQFDTLNTNLAAIASAVQSSGGSGGSSGGTKVYAHVVSFRPDFGPAPYFDQLLILSSSETPFSTISEVSSHLNGYHLATGELFNESPYNDGTRALLLCAGYNRSITMNKTIDAFGVYPSTIPASAEGTVTDVVTEI